MTTMRPNTALGDRFLLCNVDLGFVQDPLHQDLVVRLGVFDLFEGHQGGVEVPGQLPGQDGHLEQPGHYGTVWALSLKWRGGW